MNRSLAVALLVLNLAVTAWLASTLPQTTFDYNFDKFFKRNDPYTTYFERHRDTFGTDNDFILIGISNRNGVFNEAFMNKVDSLGKAIASIELIEQVVSPTNAWMPVREPLTGVIFKKPLLTGNWEADSARISTDPSAMAELFAESGSSITLVALGRQMLNKDQCDTVAEGIQNALSAFDFDEVHVAGRAIGQVVYIKKIQEEFLLFMAISIAFVVVLLFVMFRSFRGIAIPVITVLLAVVWSVGILNLSGRGISILLNMLPPVIFVVGMSDAVHLYSRYLEELSRGKSKREAIRLMIFDTGLATLLTSVTTAIGFASLWFTGIPVLREFGLLTAVGVLVAYIIAITVLPAWLSLTSEPLRTLRHPGHNRWNDLLHRSFFKVIRAKRTLFIATGVLVAVCAITASRIGLDNHLLEDLRPGEPLRTDFEWFEHHFSGVRPFELGIRLRGGEGTILSEKGMRDIERIEGYLSENYGAGAIQSLARAGREWHRARNGGRAQFYTLPADSAATAYVLSDLQRTWKARKLKALLDSTGTYARITGRVGDWGGKAFSEKDRQLAQWLHTEGLDREYEVQVTGTGTLIDRTNQNLVWSLSRGLGAAFGLISLIMGLMFRSVRMVLIALVPNVLPLLAVAAVMTLSGIDLKMSTSIIFTIAFGIAVDDTIHMLSRYKLELVKGRSRLVALRNAYVYTGKALIITSIILFGGFVGMCFSTFQSTFYIGLLVTLTLLFALVFDLSLLPAMVAAISRRNGPRGTLTTNGSDGLHRLAQQANSAPERSNANDISQIPGQVHSSGEQG